MYGSPPKILVVEFPFLPRQNGRDVRFILNTSIRSSQLVYYEIFGADCEHLELVVKRTYLYTSAEQLLVEGDSVRFHPKFDLQHFLEVGYKKDRRIGVWA